MDRSRRDSKSTISETASVSTRKTARSENTIYEKDSVAPTTLSVDTLWDIESGTQKWKNVRAGSIMKYEPFEVAMELPPEPDKPPFDPDEPMDDTRNWPKSCPFIHMDFNDFKIRDKQNFARFLYHFWHYLTLVLVWNMLGQITTQLISASPKTESVVFAFLLAFCGFWWFYFAYFRCLYLAMRHRNNVLYTLFMLHTTVLFALAMYYISNNVGSMVQMLSPLAPGSPIPVRQNPKIASIFVAMSMFLWFSVMMTCFYIIRKSFYFKNLPLEEEFAIYRKEMATPMRDSANAFSKWLREKFAAVADPALEPVRCGLLVPGLGGKEVWIQGKLTFEQTCLDFEADLPIFDHLIKEKYSYFDVTQIRKYQKTMLVVTIELGRKKRKVELIFDLLTKAERTHYFSASRKLWSNVHRNTDLIIAEHERLLKAGLLREPYEAPFEMFSKARRLETQQRARENLITYSSWQKLLSSVEMKVCKPGEVVLDVGERIEKIYHIAQGGLRVIDKHAKPEKLEQEKARAEHKARASDEVMDWVQEKLDRNEELKRQEAEWGPAAASNPQSPGELPVFPNRSSNASATSSEGEDSESDEEDEYKEGIAPLQKKAFFTEGVTLGVLRKNDVFGVVPFLLHYDPTARPAKSNMVFEVTEPNTVIFSFDSAYLKDTILRSKKDVTSAWFKYLAVILGERIEVAEDAMFMRHLEDTTEAINNAQEELLEKERREQEEFGFIDDGGMKPLSIQELFGFDVTERLVQDYKGDFITYGMQGDSQREFRWSGHYYVTDHYLAFVGKNKISLSRKEHKVVVPFDTVVYLRLEGKKAILMTDQSLEKKMIVLKTSKDRDAIMEDLQKKWRRENMERPAQARALLRRRITMLTDHRLSFVEHSFKQNALVVMAELSEKDKKGLFMGTVPIAMQRNQMVIQEDMVNTTLYLLQSGTIRIQRLREHVGGAVGSGRMVEKVVFHEINNGEIFGFDSFLTGEPSSSSYLVDSEKAIIRCCTKEQIMEKLREDKRLATKFYRVAAIALALRLAEISPLDVFF